MSRFRIFAAAAALALPLPAFASDEYTAKMTVSEAGTVVASGVASTTRGEPVRMSVTGTRRFGGEGAEPVETGFRFEMLPRPMADGMHVDFRLDLSEVTDEATGAVAKEAATFDGVAEPTRDGWVYETDRLPGGKMLKVTFGTVRDSGGTDGSIGTSLGDQAR